MDVKSNQSMTEPGDVRSDSLILYTTSNFHSTTSYGVPKRKKKKKDNYRKKPKGGTLEDN